MNLDYAALMRPKIMTFILIFILFSAFSSFAESAVENLENNSVTLASEEPIELKSNQEANATKRETKEEENAQVYTPLDIPDNISSFDFNFKDESLVSVINRLARLLKINIILPQGNDEIKQKITFKPRKNPVSFKEAFNLLETFLDLAGYALVSKPGKLYSIVKIKEKYNIPESLPLYINVAPEDIPFSDSPIRAIFYLTNLKVPSDQLKGILGDLLTSVKSFSFDAQTNGIIITDRANLVSTAMKIITELDNLGTKNSVVMVPLYNTNAVNLVERIKKDIIGLPDNQPTFLFNEPKTESAVYFSKTLRLAAWPYLNSIIITGKQNAVERMQDFIEDVLDAPLEQGDSVLHYYDLQYVLATDLEPVLKRLFLSAPGPGEQATATQSANELFRGVQIVAEKPRAQQAENTTEAVKGFSTTGVFRGGNRLLVSARQEAWAIIKKTIEEIDKPIEQVIVEVVIADLTVTDNRILGSDVRSTLETRFNQQGTFQFANLSNMVEPASPTTLETDLLGKFFNVDGTPASLAAVLSSQNPGSLILSYNSIDPTNAAGGISALLQLLKSSTVTKIISRPYIVTTNNKTASVDISDIRRDVGEANLIASGGAINVPAIDITATIKVRITPRTSSKERVNLTLQISINEFADQALNSTNLTIATRVIDTTANLSTGQVLVLGGLLQDSEAESDFETPILSKIPIIGYFFKKKQKIVTKSNLAVFVCPTIVEPRIRDGLHKYTNIKTERAEYDANDVINAADLRDPITRFYFKSRVYDHQTIEGYLEDIEKRKITRAERRKKYKHIKPVQISPQEEEPVKQIEAAQAVVAEVPSKRTVKS